jgi:hypothetical protein
LGDAFELHFFDGDCLVLHLLRARHCEIFGEWICLFVCLLDRSTALEVVLFNCSTLNVQGWQVSAG